MFDPNFNRDTTPIGRIACSDYRTAVVITDDYVKRQVGGIPNTCFLVASVANDITLLATEDQESLLMMAVDRATLPTEQQNIETKLDAFARLENPQAQLKIDPFTQAALQKGAIECIILGTFFCDRGQLTFGSDCDNFDAYSQMNVYKPSSQTLEKIINHRNPNSQLGIFRKYINMGVKKIPAQSRIGALRYASTKAHESRSNQNPVPYKIDVADMLWNRTIILGKTRTGKTVLAKHLILELHKLNKLEPSMPVGQIILDLSGEYTHPTSHDKSIAEILPDDCIRYSIIDQHGFRTLKSNFYLQLSDGFDIISSLLADEIKSLPQDIKTVLEGDLDEPDPSDFGEHSRWEVRVAAYRSALYRAGFEAHPDFRVRFKANQGIREAVEQTAGRSFPDPKTGLSLSEAVEWLLSLRTSHLAGILPSSSGTNGCWVDDRLMPFLNVLAASNSNGGSMRGFKLLGRGKAYHSSDRDEVLFEEIYQALSQGKIILCDLSAGPSFLKQTLSERIAGYILSESMAIENRGEQPPFINVTVEECHNVIPKSLGLEEVWPKIAKEGAKFGIGLISITQEISSLHPNILKNSENWAVFHMNNRSEIKALGQYIQFDHFEDQIARNTDQGFCRIKMDSSPFIVPVQIDPFSPTVEVTEEGIHAL